MPNDHAELARAIVEEYYPPINGSGWLARDHERALLLRFAAAHLAPLLAERDELASQYAKALTSSIPDITARQQCLTPEGAGEYVDGLRDDWRDCQRERDELAAFKTLVHL